MIEYSEILKMLLLGVVAGILSGMFGIGGGLVIVPALVVIFGFPVKTAVGTSLFVILLPTGLLGVWEYWKNGDLKIAAGLWVAFGVFCGAYFGAQLAGSLSQITMKRVYAIFLLVVAIYFLLAPARSDRRRAELAAQPILPEMIGNAPDVTSSTDLPLR
jgi:uncharacterized protein